MIYLYLSISYSAFRWWSRNKKKREFDIMLQPMFNKEEGNLISVILLEEVVVLDQDTDIECNDSNNNTLNLLSRVSPR